MQRAGAPWSIAGERARERRLLGVRLERGERDLIKTGAVELSIPAARLHIGGDGAEFEGALVAAGCAGGGNVER